MNRGLRIRSPVDAILLLAIVLCVVPFFLLCFFTHPFADDFSYLHMLNARGFLGSIRAYYAGWMGMYSSTAMNNAGLLLTRAGMHWLALFLFLTILASAFVVLADRMLSGVVGRSAAGRWGLLLFVLYLANMPSVSEGLYWMTGFAGYQSGHIACLFLLALLVGPPLPRHKAVYASLCAVLAFVAAGANVTAVFLTVCVTGVGAVLFLGFRNRLGWNVALAGAVVGAIVVVIAPGNRVRAVELQGCDWRVLGDWVFAVRSSIRGALWYMRIWASDPTLLLATVLSFPVAYELAGTRPMNRLRLALIPLAWIALVAALFFPTYWVMKRPPFTRTLNTVYFGFLLGWFGSVAALSKLARQCSRDQRGFPGTLTAAKLLLAFSLLGNTNNILPAWKSLMIAPRYHWAKQRREKLIRAAIERGADSVVVPPLGCYPISLFSFDLETDPEHWVNKQHARHWGVTSVAAEPLPPGHPATEQREEVLRRRSHP